MNRRRNQICPSGLCVILKWHVVMEHMVIIQIILIFNHTAIIHSSIVLHKNVSFSFNILPKKVYSSLEIDLLLNSTNISHYHNSDDLVAFANLHLHSWGAPISIHFVQKYFRSGSESGIANNGFIASCHLLLKLSQKQRVECNDCH